MKYFSASNLTSSIVLKLTTMKNPTFFFLLLLPFLSSATTSSSSSPLPVNVWPKPTSISWPTTKSTFISPSFTITITPPQHSHSHSPNRYLNSAARRYRRLILKERHRPLRPPHLHSSSPPLLSIIIAVSNHSIPLLPSIDESYFLKISTFASASASTSTLTAPTAWGAIRGLETFSQLAWWDDDSGGHVAVPTDLEIYDKPLFGHRGVLLDTSRNYYPVKDLMRTIDAMAMNKVNVFHWHVTDSHSFPILLPSEPELAEKGAYGKEMMYTPEDVRRIVRFAMRRGVRVVPEFDAPGHTASWAEAHPDIVTCADRFWSPLDSEPLAAEPGTGQLNPLHLKTYDVYRNVLHDAADLFPDVYLHGGADEVSPGCWKTDPTIQSFLTNNGTPSQLLELFINITHPYITGELNRVAVYWEDVLLGSVVKVDSSLLPRETTVLQTWNNGSNNTKKIVSAGYRVIVSSSDFYYLDCGHGGFVGNDSRYDSLDVNDDFNYAGGNGGSWCGPFKSWQRVYDYDITHGLDKDEAKLVLGGEVALWSEQADPTVLDARLWPRASAMAEALWSGNRDETWNKRYAEATDRLNEWRYRMVGRGVMAEPIQPLWCVYHPRMCNLVM